MPFLDYPLETLRTYRSEDPEPGDFDAFWSATQAEAAQVPIDARFEKVDAGLPLVEVYDVTYAGFAGHPVKGWFLKPSAIDDGLTAVVKFVGYNGGRGFPQEHLLWPASGRAVLVMDNRGQGSGWSRGDTVDPIGSHPAQAGFMTKGVLDPATYFYRRVFVDATRAVAVARLRPEVARDRIVVAGGSQGGGVTLAVAGLDANIRAAMPDVPFLCHYKRAVGLALRDPYGEIARYLAVHREKVATVFRTLSYYDGINFARRARAPALFSVALMDDICPPSTVYAAYNDYAGDKAIETYTYNNHEGGGTQHERAQLAWLAEQGV
jgi:cephalosporin-C deacetylase